MTNIVLVILGMTVVTYVPRLLPLVLKRNTEPPDWLKRTLALLPFTAIGALIVPDAFYSVGDTTIAPLAGLATAAVLTWLTRQPFVAVIGAVMAVAGIQAFVG